MFPRVESMADERLIGYTNSNWSGDVDDRKSTSDYNVMRD